MKKNSSLGKFYLALVIFSLVGQVAWVVENMYLNVFIYKMFHATAEQISLMVAASAVTATVTTLLIGALSDKLGRRKVFICAGYILWGLSIFAFGLIRAELVNNLFFPTVAVGSAAMSLCITLTIVLDCVMTFFGSSANDAAFNAWLTDSTDETNRGAAEGINAMMPLMAILVVFGGFMGMDQSKEADWTLIFSIIGGVVTVLGIAGFFLIKENTVKIPENQNYFANIFYGFRPSVMKANKRLYVTLILLALFNISIQIFMPYLILYYTETLGLTDYVLIFAPAIILSAAFTAVYGRVYDKHGFKTAIFPVLGLLMAGYVVLFFVRNTALVFAGSLLLLCGFIGTGAIIGALIRDCTPKNKAGMFQGLRIVGQVLIPGVVGPAIGAAVLKNADTVTNTDGTTSFIPNENIFLAAFIAAIAAWLILIPLLKLLKKK
ncbi:MAG: MFS transporter [Ruminococcaceae bacterium]|nr:MFS transporter [Oscillospiraceae bacterium]